MPKSPDPNSVPPLPEDAPLLSIDDAAVYLRMTPDALRQALKGYSNPTLAMELRELMIKISPRRRYFAKRRFLECLRNR